MPRDIVARHFRQIVVWPIQLMPLRPGEQVRRHWEALDAATEGNLWRRQVDEFGAGVEAFRQREYKEFVTFLPYVQRFLFGAAAGQESARSTDTTMRVYRRDDIAAVRIAYADGAQLVFDIDRAELHFFLDADVAIVVLEIHAGDLSLDRAQDTLFRFGRAYPAFWEPGGSVAGNCPRLVEWLGRGGLVLACSDFDDQEKYLAFVHRHRASCIARHWEFLLRPLVLERRDQAAKLRYRQLEYYRMPFMTYLAVDDPAELTRADFVRLGLVTRPGNPDALPYSESSLESFEREHCDDRFWGRTGERFSGDTRIVVTASALSVVGRHGDRFFADPDVGMHAQFRHQYFLLFLIAHFHKAALVSMSDELAVAMNRLVVGDTESVRQFKRTIRQMMEVFLRFTHRYWFSEVSHQSMARGVFARLHRHLRLAELYSEVRNEVSDMNAYLDSDSARRQANTILRLTVVTILGLIGTVASGLLGMNLLDEAHRPAGVRLGIFIAVALLTSVLTVATIVKSKGLADFLETLSNRRVGWRGKWQSLLRAFG